ncbi:unnamed protein product [Taenia asiatica]|uniref:SAM domain-containing protein n=1 Tax=Taenia asiatica TaxID=60517 RepID=A0A0R3WGR7_TAEAS|nr:unnamed protein product [Taenia asiatica]
MQNNIEFACQLSIDVESLYEDINFSDSISRHDFEQLGVLSGAKLDRGQRLLRDFFGVSKLKRSINPDRTSAYGVELLGSSMINKLSLVLLEAAQK